MQTVEFIESYKKVGNDYQWNDNHGQLVRCRDCKNWEGESDAISAMCDCFECYLPAAFFCASGERKEE